MNRYLQLIKNTQNWYVYFHRKLTGSKNEMIFRADNDVKIIVPVRGITAIFKELFMEDAYQFPLLKKHLPSNPKIIDIGANVGYFELFMFSKFPESEVYAYEPMPANFEMLKKHKGMNANKIFNIYQAAVSSEVGEMELFFDDANILTPVASLKKNFEGRSDESSLKVNTTTLTDIINDNHLKRVDLLKMDCEGAEYDILYNTEPTVFSNIKMIAMETHEGTKADESQSGLVDFFVKLGFETRVNSQGMLWAWK